MAYDSKYGQVSTEHGFFYHDEPVIIFRARDKTVLRLLDAYVALCGEAGSPNFHLDLVQLAQARIRQWQNDNLDKVHTPDSASHQQRLS